MADGALVAGSGGQPTYLDAGAMTWICGDRLEASADLLESAFADARARGSLYGLRIPKAAFRRPHSSRSLRPS